MTKGARVERWFTALCAVPWLMVGGAYLEAFAARLVLSRWPQPSHDDPKQLATAPVHLVLQLVLISLGVAIPLVVVFVMWNWRKVVSDWRYRVRIAVFGVGVAAFWILTRYDPGRIWDWFFD
jgi:hypothetical protein